MLSHKMQIISSFCCLLLIASVTPIAIDVTTCDGTAKRGDGITCYKVYKIEDSFDNAMSHCQGNGLNMVSISSDVENDAVINLMTSAAISEIWINLKLTVTAWRWPDGSELMEQGCYNGHDSMTLTETKPADNSFWTCSATCQSKYVGLMNGIECLCGDKFGENGQAGAQCQTACPASSGEQCGGSDSQRIVAIGGVYSNWLSNQPNDGGSDGDLQRCSIMEDNFQWNDIDCQSRYHAICDINLSPELFPACDETKPGVHSIRTSQNNTCIYVTDSTLSYFEAVRECFRFNGSLLKIHSKEFNDAIGKVLADKLPLWIGATRFKQTENSGNDVTFSAWSPSVKLNQSGYGLIRRSDITINSQSWNIADKSQRKFIVCQTSNATFISIPSYFATTTATTTALPQTKFVVSPVSTTIPTLPPTNYTLPPQNTNNDNSKANSGVPNNQVLNAIIGGVVGGGVLLIIIAVVVIVVICKRKRGIQSKKHVDEESVQPSYFFGTDQMDTMTSTKSMSKSIPDSISVSSPSPSPPPYKF